MASLQETNVSVANRLKKKEKKLFKFLFDIEQE